MGGNPPGRRCGRPALLGLRATAIVGVIVQPVCLEAAAREIATFEEVSYLVMTSGTFDLLVKVLYGNTEHLACFLSDKLLRRVHVRIRGRFEGSQQTLRSGRGSGRHLALHS